MIWLKYDAFYGNQTNTDDLIRMGIDNSCQVNRKRFCVKQMNKINEFKFTFKGLHCDPKHSN